MAHEDRIERSARASFSVAMEAQAGLLGGRVLDWDDEEITEETRQLWREIASTSIGEWLVG